VIYLDTSVALAHLLSEDRRPADSLWEEPLVSSRLMEFELRVRINARGLAASHGELVSLMLQRVAFLEMVEPVLERAREPFPIPVRTLDALHLASTLFLREQGARVRLATYDTRLVEAAGAVEVEVDTLHL
jgi:predicted nucleic acid-binding protein